MKSQKYLQLVINLTFSSKLLILSFLFFLITFRGGFPIDCVLSSIDFRSNNTYSSLFLSNEWNIFFPGNSTSFHPIKKIFTLSKENIISDDSDLLLLFYSFNSPPKREISHIYRT